MNDRSPSRQTISTWLSVDHTVASEHPTVSTTLTIPDQISPRKHDKGLSPLVEAYEGSQPGSSHSSLNMGRPREAEVVRGPSVKDRASQFESQVSAARLPPPRTRSTSPLRINRSLVSSGPRTPTGGRLPEAPRTAPDNFKQQYEVPVSPSPRRSPSRRASAQLTRGQGSTKRMVQQWEEGATTQSYTPPAKRPLPVPESLSKDYLNKKPLPTPTPMAGPSSVAASPSRPLPRSPARNIPSARPSNLLQTPPAARYGSLPNSPSSWTISPSGEKKRKTGRSPLKDMLNIFGGGKLRKHKAKSSDKLRDQASPIEGVGGRFGTSGLPGGIVLRDRMGEEEMRVRPPEDQLQVSSTRPSVCLYRSHQVVRSSAIIYLAPTPCSSLSPWGSWLTSWAVLTPNELTITYCPIFQDPEAGHATPKRVFSTSASTLHKHLEPAIDFSTIPVPGPDTPHDVRLSMAECVEVRSLRKEEVKGRGVPAVPESNGTEVLEMVWSDGGKRYIGVEGVAGRLDWVSAIW